MQHCNCFIQTLKHTSLLSVCTPSFFDCVFAHSPRCSRVFPCFVFVLQPKLRKQETVRSVLLQPAEVTKPSYPGSYSGGWATLHREAKNSSDWPARREWSQTALTGWAAFMVRNDDAAVSSVACGHIWSVASFTVISLFSFQSSSAAGSSCERSYTPVDLHMLQTHMHRRPFPFVTDVGCHSQQLKENCSRNSAVERLSPADFLVIFQWSACSYSPFIRSVSQAPVCWG